MANESKQTGQALKAKADESARQFVARLSGEEIMLLRLRDDLYEGRWDAMLADLNDRLQGKPYVFKLAHRIQDDIERIERLHRFERQYDVNLAKLI
jgi:GGDEF domain-containing protein